MAKRKQTNAYITSRQVAPRSCPSCRQVLDGCTSASVGGAPPETPPQPRPGDVTLCAYCGAVLVTLKAGYRLAHQEEIDALPPVVRRLYAQWRPQRLYFGEQ